MNWNRMCPGCMHELTDEEMNQGKCPHCGFAAKQEEREDALPVLTILGGKYLIGKILERDKKSVTYLAYDLNLEVKIQIAEYFPPVLAKRDDDGRNVVPHTEETKEAYEQGKKNYLENARQIIKLVTQTGGENLIRDFFEENNTVYAALIDRGMPSVTAMPENIASESTNSTKGKKRKLCVAIVAVLLVCLCVFAGVFLLSRNGNFKIVKNWEPVYKSFMLGTLYDEDIVVFATDNSLYYSEYDENGELYKVYWLAGLNVDEAMYSVAADQKHLYVSITNHGVWRADVETEDVKYEQVVARDVTEFLLYDKYILYAEGNVLYCAKKDGSNEIVLAENASDIFAVYDNFVYFYVNADRSIYRTDFSGAEPTKLETVNGVTNMQASGQQLWLIVDGILCEGDIKTGKIIEKTDMENIGKDSDIYIFGEEICFLSNDHTKLVQYNVDTQEQVILYDGEEILMTGKLGDRLLVVNVKGEYFSIETDTKDLSKLQFNYLSMEEDCEQ